MLKKKVAILINALEGAGAEKVISEIINHFYTDFDIHLILLNGAIEFKLPLNDITVVVIDNSNLKKSNRLTDILKTPFLASRLKKYLIKNEIGVCFSALNRSNFINCFQKILGWKGKVLISERSHTSSVYDPKSMAGKTARFLVKWLYKKADMIIPNSKGIEYNLRNEFHLQNQFRVIYNPINIESHDNAELEPVDDVAFDNFTFIVVGRFEKTKNQQMVLDAIQLIKEHSFKVIFAGQGKTLSIIQQNAKEMGISDKTVFLGHKKNVIKYISQSQCSLMTSNFEGFPNVLLESLASSTPVISTDCQTGPRELLDDNFIPNYTAIQIEKVKYGILIPLNNPTLLADAMLMIMNDKDLQLKYADAGRKRSQDFNLSIIMKQYRDVFENA